MTYIHSVFLAMLASNWPDIWPYSTIINETHIAWNRVDQFWDDLELWKLQSYCLILISMVVLWWIAHVFTLVTVEQNQSFIAFTHLFRVLSREVLQVFQCVLVKINCNFFTIFFNITKYRNLGYMYMFILQSKDFTCVEVWNKYVMRTNDKPVVFTERQHGMKKARNNTAN